MISVIIPAYKARKYLPDCLESIGKQTLQPKEILVIDDASPEPVDDIINEFSSKPGYPPLRLIKHEINRGQAAGRNTGMKAASGGWLAFIDCDDMWAPRHLESLMSLAETSGADLAFSPAVLFDADPYDPQNYTLRPLNEDEAALRPFALLNRCFIITSSTLIRKEQLANVNGFDEDQGLRGVEDLDCFMRLLEAGAKFSMSQHATLHYRKHPESATGTPGYLTRQCVKLLYRHINSVEGTKREKSELIMQTHWHCAISLWLVKAHDRNHWLCTAVKKSLPYPQSLLRWAYRFLRAVMKKSGANLHNSMGSSI